MTTPDQQTIDLDDEAFQKAWECWLHSNFFAKFDPDISLKNAIRAYLAHANKQDEQVHVIVAGAAPGVPDGTDCLLYSNVGDRYYQEPHNGDPAKADLQGFRERMHEVLADGKANSLREQLYPSKQDAPRSKCSSCGNSGWYETGTCYMCPSKQDAPLVRNGVGTYGAGIDKPDANYSVSVEASKQDEQPVATCDDVVRLYAHKQMIEWDGEKKSHITFTPSSETNLADSECMGSIALDRCEIPVLAGFVIDLANTMEAALKHSDGNYCEASMEVFNFIHPYLRTTEPVDLEKCAKALFMANGMGGSYWEMASKEPFVEKAKAVLDAAGVKYDNN